MKGGDRIDYTWIWNKNKDNVRDGRRDGDGKEIRDKHRYDSENDTDNVRCSSILGFSSSFEIFCRGGFYATANENCPGQRLLFSISIKHVNNCRKQRVQVPEFYEIKTK